MTNLVDNLKRRVRRLQPDLSVESERFKTYLILLASTVVGPNIKRIASLTGLTRDTVAKRARNLRDNGVWVGQSIPADWTDTRLSTTSLRQDVVRAERKVR